MHGDTGVSGPTQGFGYDPGSNSWTALPNSSNVDYRASVTVSVTMNTSRPVSQPGTYTAALAIGANTPYQSPLAGITMKVTPP